jgi:hypothetical protein
MWRYEICNVNGVNPFHVLAVDPDPRPVGMDMHNHPGGNNNRHSVAGRIPSSPDPFLWKYPGFRRVNSQQGLERHSQVAGHRPGWDIRVPAAIIT